MRFRRYNEYLGCWVMRKINPHHRPEDSPIKNLQAIEVLRQTPSW